MISRTSGPSAPSFYVLTPLKIQLWDLFGLVPLIAKRWPHFWHLLLSHCVLIFVPLLTTVSPSISELVPRTKWPELTDRHTCSLQPYIIYIRIHLSRKDILNKLWRKFSCPMVRLRTVPLWIGHLKNDKSGYQQQQSLLTIGQLSNPGPVCGDGMSLPGHSRSCTYYLWFVALLLSCVRSGCV